MLDGRQRRQLRALAHHLHPLVQVGQQGVTPAVIGAVEQALWDHELIKVKVGEGPEDRHDAAELLARETDAELVQVLGRRVVLFKQRAEDSRFALKAHSVARVEPRPEGPGQSQRPSPTRSRAKATKPARKKRPARSR